MMNKYIYIKTFGCQMNETDSERILHIFRSNGFSAVDDPLKADLIILNSCSVREKAEQKLMSLIGRFLDLKKVNPYIKVGVCGCTVQKDPKELSGRFKELDFIFGTYDIPDAFHIYEKSLAEPSFKIREFPEYSLDEIRDYDRKMPHKAFVTIMEGCDNYCSYCIIPFVRGRERSRKKESILKEIKMLLENGVKEITLIGQNVNRYNRDGILFTDLLKEIAQLDKLYRLRFITNHPRDINDKLFELFAIYENICPSIHLPVQSGSDKILKLMNRGYTSLEYMQKIKKLRDYKKDIIITTDVIVGFPGEKHEDFMDTINLIKEIEFWGCFSFKYSIRYPSKASSYEDDVPHKEKLERLYTLQDIQNKITRKINETFVNQTHRVLIDGFSKKNNEILMGKNEYNITVNFSRGNKKESELGIGDFADIKIENYSNNSLIGIIN